MRVPCLFGGLSHTRLSTSVIETVFDLLKNMRSRQPFSILQYSLISQLKVPLQFQGFPSIYMHVGLSGVTILPRTRPLGSSSWMRSFFLISKNFSTGRWSFVRSMTFIALSYSWSLSSLAKNTSYNGDKDFSLFSAKFNSMTLAEMSASPQNRSVIFALLKKT